MNGAYIIPRLRLAYFEIAAGHGDCLNRARDIVRETEVKKKNFGPYKSEV